MKDYILSYKSMILQGNLQENIEIIWTQLYIFLIVENKRMQCLKQ